MATGIRSGLYGNDDIGNNVYIGILLLLSSCGGKKQHIIKRVEEMLLLWDNRLNKYSDNRGSGVYKRSWLIWYYVDADIIHFILLAFHKLIPLMSICRWKAYNNTGSDCDCGCEWAHHMIWIWYQSKLNEISPSNGIKYKWRYRAVIRIWQLRFNKDRGWTADNTLFIKKQRKLKSISNSIRFSSQMASVVHINGNSLILLPSIARQP